MVYKFFELITHIMCSIYTHYLVLVVSIQNIVQTIGYILYSLNVSNGLFFAKFGDKSFQCSFIKGYFFGTKLLSIGEIVIKLCQYNTSIILYITIKTLSTEF